MIAKDLTVLKAMSECTLPEGMMCRPFKAISRQAAMDDVKEVRRIVRRLSRKGLAQYWRGLWDEYGDGPAGAGYCITDAGLAVLGKERAPPWRKTPK